MIFRKAEKIIFLLECLKRLGRMVSANKNTIFFYEITLFLESFTSYTVHSFIDSFVDITIII